MRSEHFKFAALVGVAVGLLACTSLASSDAGSPEWPPEVPRTCANTACGGPLVIEVARAPLTCGGSDGGPVFALCAGGSYSACACPDAGCTGSGCPACPGDAGPEGSASPQSGESGSRDAPAAD